MTDPKKNPNKQHRSFFWRRTPLHLPEQAKPMNGFEEAQREARPWYRPTLMKAAVVGLGVLAILPPRANGQFGIDTAAILAALSKMQSLMSTYIAAPLKTINQYEQSVAKYEQEGRSDQAQIPMELPHQCRHVARARGDVLLHVEGFEGAVTTRCRRHELHKPHRSLAR